LKDNRKVFLDFSEVTFVDGRGAEMVNKLAGEGIKVVDCCELIKELLEGGGKK
jgi:anti-anti-sigma regulatory factor